jgi:hypothetical protein
MKFMIIRKADRDTEAGVMPPEKLLADMASYNQALLDAGALVTGQGLKPSARGARVKFTRGKPTIVDGPFTEAKELVAGFTIIDVASKAAALDWARRWPTSDGNGEAELEIRELYELSDFAPGPGLEHHREIFDELSKQR